jgi:predicted transcriptional regulator
MSKQTICPNTKFEAIIKILNCLKNPGTLTIKQISEQISHSIYWVNNAIPIMAEMGFVYRGNNELIGITSKGKEFIESFNNNDTEKIKNYAEQILEKSNILRYAKKILDENQNISMKDFGRKLADELKIPQNKRWKNDTTFAMVGRSCWSILGGLRLIEYIPQRRSRSNINRFQNKIMPYASIVLIIEMLNKFNTDDNIYQVPSEELTQYQRQRQTDYLNTMIMLGLVNRIPGNDYLYELTFDGIKLKESQFTLEHAKTLKNILLKNIHVHEIIKTIHNNYTKIDAIDVGTVLEGYNQTNWSDGTKEAYGHNFINWLIVAGIFVRLGKENKYIFQPDFIIEFKNINYESSESILKEQTEIVPSPESPLPIITIKQTSVGKSGIDQVIDGLKALHYDGSHDLHFSEEIIDKIEKYIEILEKYKKKIDEKKFSLNK